MHKVRFFAPCTSSCGKGGGAGSNWRLRGSEVRLSLVLMCWRTVNSYSSVAWSMAISRATMASSGLLALPFFSMWTADFVCFHPDYGAQAGCYQQAKGFPKCHVLSPLCPCRTQRGLVMRSTPPLSLLWASLRPGPTMITPELCVNARTLLTSGVSFALSRALIHTKEWAIRQARTRLRARCAPSLVAQRRPQPFKEWSHETHHSRNEGKCASQ